MKKILLLLAFFLPLSLFSYYGDIENFIIEENSICLNAPEEASRSFLSTESAVSKNAIWSSEITLLFSPTSSNYLRWYLMADSASLNNSSNAYYVQFGGSARTISFYYLKGGKSTLVHQERQMLLDNSSNYIKIKIIRTESDNWTLSYMLNDTLSVVSEFHEDRLNFSSFSGWQCVYTKTRSKSFCFANSRLEGQAQKPPRLPMQGELLINEILFNPKDDGVDFIEILNVSDAVFDLSNCMLGNRKQTYAIGSFMLYPDSCVAITKDSAVLCSQFHCLAPRNILQVEKMLPLLNDSGYIRLICDTTIIDTLLYKQDMHHVLLDDVEGLSLERVSDTHWQSASTIIKATPGYKNSRILEEETDDVYLEESGDYIGLLSSSAHIYNSEYPENIVLLYRLHKPKKVSVKAFSLNGYHVYTILDDELLVGQGKLYWNGRSENSKILPISVYILVVEMCSADGSYLVKKLPVAVVP